MDQSDRVDKAAVGTAAAAGQQTADRVYNDRGIIAESYYDLQGVGVLHAARESHPLPKASVESTIRAIFQSVEIALLNVADVMKRAASDVAEGSFSAAVTRMFWARGFHRLLANLSLMPQQLPFGCRLDAKCGCALRISESPAFSEYLDTLMNFDRQMLSAVHAGHLSAEDVLANRSLDSAEFNLIHLARICNHESTVWEYNLTEVPIPSSVASYADFVVTAGMRDAVYDRVLKGDTYFTQFRGLHQIPETLGEEINDYVEAAIRDVRGKDVCAAFDNLGCALVLIEGVLASLPAIVDNLATSDYHVIRENLGLTSGSHSICLRFHMFTHLYDQLWQEFRSYVSNMYAPEPGDAQFDDAALRLLEDVDDPRAWIVRLFWSRCLSFRALIFRWRDEHLNLPRNNLGGGATKSLTGSPDAVQAVKHMLDAARNRDAAPRVGIAAPSHARNSSPQGQLTTYLGTRDSFDSYILEATGRVTQFRFREVQERLGFFANRCPFTAPPRREA